MKIDRGVESSRFRSTGRKKKKRKRTVFGLGF